MPPRAAFDHRRRPSGLEFPSCGPCNAGTRLPDLVAALMSRICSTEDIDAVKSGKDSDEAEATDAEYLNNLLQAVSNNIPGLLEQMDGRRASAKILAGRLGFAQADNFLQVGNLAPLYLEVFAAKLGFALHFLLTGSAVPVGGAVVAAWRTNVQDMEQGFPDSVLSALGPIRTLTQGKFSVLKQFGYAAGVGEDGQLSGAVAGFRASFAAMAFASTNAAVFDRELGSFRLFLPGDLRKPIAAFPYYRVKVEGRVPWPRGPAGGLTRR